MRPADFCEACRRPMHDGRCADAARIAELEAKLAAAHKALDAWEASMYGKCVCKYAGDCDIRGCEINEARRLTAEAREGKS